MRRYRQQSLRQSGRDYRRLPRTASNRRAKSSRQRTPLARACNNVVMDESLSLWALFASSFLAATLLPGGSEAVLFGVLKIHPQQYWLALAVATLGNTLGGMSSYLIGRLFPQKLTPHNEKYLAGLRRYGAPALLAA